MLATAVVITISTKITPREVGILGGIIKLASEKYMGLQKILLGEYSF